MINIFSMYYSYVDRLVEAIEGSERASLRITRAYIKLWFAWQNTHETMFAAHIVRNSARRLLARVPVAQKKKKEWQKSDREK